jgi:hypothetical protein
MLETNDSDDEMIACNFTDVLDRLYVTYSLVDEDFNHEYCLSGWLDVVHPIRVLIRSGLQNFT